MAAPVVCAAVGVGALCALVMNKNRPRGEAADRVSACSARVTTASASIEEEEEKKALDLELSAEIQDDRDVWKLFEVSETAETNDWATRASHAKMSASKLSKLQGMMAQDVLETKFTKMTGPITLVHGKTPNTSKPNTTGNIPFGVNEAYHEAAAVSA